jgi:tetratricopeptide (TPR) repeat protein
MELHDPDRDAAYTVIAGQDQRVGLRAYFAFNLWSLGYPGQARQMMAEALEWSQMATHLPTRAYALTHAALLARVMRDSATAADLTREVMDLAAAHGFRLWETFALRLGANHSLERGDLDSALSLHRRAQAALEDSDTRIFSCFLEPDWAQWLGAFERSEALDLIQDVRKHVDSTEERWAETQVHCAQGDVLLMQSAPDQAEACYRRGLDVARRQEGKSWELRAAIRLARLRAGRGERREAQDLLAPIYGWFTEGFDTPDLVDAKALLDELR